METKTFLTKVNSMTDTQRQAFTDATLIPAFAVGTTDLREAAALRAATSTWGTQRMQARGFLMPPSLPLDGRQPPDLGLRQCDRRLYGHGAGRHSGVVGYAPGGSTANGISANFNIQQWTERSGAPPLRAATCLRGRPGLTIPMRQLPALHSREARREASTRRQERSQAPRRGL